MNLVYILGVGHSGTTLLDIILGSTAKSESLGELIWLSDWLNKLDTKKCSCGRSLSSCELWGTALKAWMNQIQHDGVFQYAQTQKQFEFSSSGTLHMLHRENEISHPNFSHYSVLTYQLLKHISAVNHTLTLVDSSKSPIRGHAFLHIPGLNCYFIHITRDPRAVTSSLLKRSSNRLHDLRIIARSAIGWVLRNIQCKALTKEAGPNQSIHIRYEDLVKTPYPTLDKIVNLVGKDLSPILDNISEEKPFIRKHPIDGNPMRLNKNIRIKAVDPYNEKIPTIYKYLVWIISGKYAKKYGYKLED